MLPEQQTPAPEPDRPALLRGELYASEDSTFYRTKRKTALVDMFGHGNG